MINFIYSLIIQNPQVSTATERYLFLYMIVVMVIVTFLIIVFFIVFQKRKNKLLMDNIKQKQLFEEELSNTQIEIQEQTLKNIGQELHDNIGQLLSVANMQLSILSTEVPEAIKERFIETKNVVKDGLREVRALSKSLNSDVIVNRGFQLSVENEVERLNKLKLIETHIEIKGDKTLFKNNKDSIILFRIIQEFFSNTIKYASAKALNVIIDYQENMLIINVFDDGKGFDMKTVEKGSGFINMESRAKLIHADFKLETKLDKGTQLVLTYPYRQIEGMVL